MAPRSRRRVGPPPAPSEKHQRPRRPDAPRPPPRAPPRPRARPRRDARSPVRHLSHRRRCRDFGQLLPWQASARGYRRRARSCRARRCRGGICRGRGISGSPMSMPSSRMHLREGQPAFVEFFVFFGREFLAGVAELAVAGGERLLASPGRSGRRRRALRPASGLRLRPRGRAGIRRIRATLLLRRRAPVPPVPAPALPPQATNATAQSPIAMATASAITQSLFLISSPLLVR